MKAPETPQNEIYRLEALRSLDLLDTENEQNFDDVVEMGCDLFDVPICLVSLVDSERQWFKAKAGLETQETSREISFCGHAILSKEVFVVLDTHKDDRFRDNPLVTHGLKLRFYAGAPITLPSGYAIGTVCLLSDQPRTRFSQSECLKLESLARFAVNVISTRAIRYELDQERSVLDRYRMIADLSDAPIALLDPGGAIQECNSAFADLCAAQPYDHLMITEVFPGLIWPLPPEKGESQSIAREKSIAYESGRLQVIEDALGFLLIGRTGSGA